MTAAAVKSALDSRVEPGRKAKNEWFFKSGPGHYSEGDEFIGVRAPDQRAVAKSFRDLALNEVKKLLNSPVHEHRLTAAMILTYQYNQKTAKVVYDFYMDTALYGTTRQVAPDFRVEDRRKGIDNWDIVDSSAHKIVGRYLADKSDRSILYDLADHPGLWQNRVAMVATWWFIDKRGELDDCFALAEKFLTHKHDLMHKATGWMLREAGKQDESALMSFLDEFAPRMPRTMLRYAIERLPPPVRTRYMGVKLAK
ncbi:MAG: DNA alkylation repair protein [Candidatus Saccharibacteria bacterium]|nr:DNA alkylation repair protein [Candidatus Saccharibacteria bacterium]